ncbi:hypothetical protein SAV31267_034990 [Streptomyces avermitilis]|uniref:Uncharacterized protein n=1 Tax=Streptomyces avermitilis TaxID=33903 RepID=A0A4D4MQP9_STRAX|nr:hypothetical protein SAV31267_034990 [Streptomyces avermitilis]
MVAEADVLDGDGGDGRAVHPQIDACAHRPPHPDRDRAVAPVDAFVQGDQRARVVARFGPLRYAQCERHGDRVVRWDGHPGARGLRPGPHPRCRSDLVRTAKPPSRAVL